MQEYIRVLPLHSQEGYKNRALSESYTNALGELDFGALLSFLDFNCGEVAYRQTGTRAVTAAMEAVSVEKPMTLDMDYEMTLRVTKTWNKSLEIGVEVNGNDGKRKNHLIDFYFTFVGVDENGKPIEIRKDTPSTRAEFIRAQQAEKRKESYLSAINNPIRIIDLTTDEQMLIRELQNSKTSGRAGYIGVNETKQEIVESMVPRNQNIYGKIFGGHILDRTFNIAWHHAYDYIGRNLPLVAAVNRVNFQAPINIGDIVRYKVSTIYTHNTSLVEEVIVTTENPLTRESKITNTCSYTFVAIDSLKKPSAIPRTIVPISNQEIISWVEANRRRLLHKKTDVLPISKIVDTY